MGVLRPCLADIFHQQLEPDSLRPRRLEGFLLGAQQTGRREAVPPQDLGGRGGDKPVPSPEVASLPAAVRDEIGASTAADALEPENELLNLAKPQRSSRTVDRGDKAVEQRMGHVG